MGQWVWFSDGFVVGRWGREIEETLSGSQITHNNHYVPQFYLKQWSRDGSTVKVYDTIVCHENVRLWRKQGIKNCAYMRDLYTTVVNSEPFDGFEKELSDKYEAPAQPALRRVSEGVSLREGDMTALVNLLIAQLFRTPAAYSFLMDLYERSVNVAISETLNELSFRDVDGANDAAKSLSACRVTTGLAHPEGFPLNVATNHDKGFVSVRSYTGRQPFLLMLEQYFKGDVAACLHSKRWRIFRLPFNCEVPTCDNPVVVAKPISFNRIDRGLHLGLDTPGVIVFMPLAPCTVIAAGMGWSRMDSSYIPIGPKLARFFRTGIVHNATRYIYALEEMPEVVKIRPRIIDKNFDCGCRRQLEDWRRGQERLEREFTFFS